MTTEVTTGTTLPPPIPQFGAQLAGNAKGMTDFAGRDEYVFEEKLDGMRGILVIQPNGRMELRNRDGENKGRLAKNPWLSGALHEWTDQMPELMNGTAFDGELVADTWNQTMHEIAGNGDSVRFVVFDIPFLMGTDMRRMPFFKRRAFLEKLFEGKPEGGSCDRVVLSPLLPYSDELAGVIWGHGGEGVIAKNVNSIYGARDRKGWSKIKEVLTGDAIITGYKPGNGKYSNTIGAVEISQYRNDELVQVTEISGMDDAQRYAFSEADLGRVIEFKYTKRLTDTYRHPRWSRWRDDKNPLDCTWEATE